MEELLDLSEKLPKFEPEKFVHRMDADGCYRGGVLSVEEVDAGVQKLEGYVAEIHTLSKGVVSSYIRIGCLLREIDQQHLYDYVHIKAQSFIGVCDFAYKIFGFKQSTTYGLMNVVKRFAPEGEILPEYRDYSYSKLVELLPVTEESNLRRFSPEMTVQEIREVRKEWTTNGWKGAKDWKEVLQRSRERAAKEAEEARKAKEKKPGLLELLSGKPSEPMPAVPVESVRKVYESGKPVVRSALELKNKKAREDWMNNFQSWGVWFEVPELELKCYRFSFQNGANLTVTVGKEYWDSWSMNKGAHDKIIYTIQDEEHKVFSIVGSSFTAVIEWLTKHAKEI